MSDSQTCTRELHKKLNTFQHDVIHQGAGQYLVSACAGCLAGDTIVEINRAGISFKITIEELVHKFNGGVIPSGHYGQVPLYWDLNIETKIRARAEDGYVKLFKLQSAYKSGVKETFTIETKNGNSIRATKDHKFLTSLGWKTVSALTVSDWVYVLKPLDFKDVPPKKKPYYFQTSGMHGHPYRCHRGSGRYSVATHRLVVEAALNGLDYIDYIALFKNKNAEYKNLVFLNPEKVYVHHLDEDTKNNKITNLQILPAKDHAILHGTQENWKHVTQSTFLDEIISIKPNGAEATYDLGLATEPHNFIANNFVVHNSGKTHTLIYRIEQLVYDGANPNDIGVFTFAKDAANELQKRLKDLGLKDVTASTLHSLCYSILREDGKHLGGDFLIDDKSLIFYQTKDFISKLFRGVGLDAQIANALFGLAKAYCLSAHPVNQDQDKEPIIELFKKVGEKPWLADAYYNLFKDVEAWKVSKRLIDYSDQLYLSWLLLIDNAEIQDKWSSKFQYLLIDEGQDSSIVQNAIGLMLSKKHENIMIVGDVLQCVPGDQPVITAAGYPVLIKNLKVGDLVRICRGGKPDIDRIIKIETSRHTTAIQFTLDDGRQFTVTKNHACFAALDSPNGCYVYLMHKEDLGYRIGVTETFGNNGRSLIARTQQEGADRMWVIGWFATYAEAAEREAFLSLEYQIPKEPFRERDGMWINKESATKLFVKFGQNGSKLLEALNYDFDRPNYIGKSSGSYRVAVNLNQATNRYSEVCIESGGIAPAARSKWGFTLGRRETYRLRRSFRRVVDAENFAEALAADLGGYVVRSLSNTGIARRMHEVRAANLHENMLVPVAVDGTKIELHKVVSRKIISCTELCFDLEMENEGNFNVNGVIVHNSLYKWRGANPEEFINFSKKFKTYRLPVNYRSTKEICNAATSLTKDLHWNITGETLAHDAAPTDAQSLLATEYESPDDEANAIAEEILKLNASGKDFKDIAILYRLVSLLAPIENALAQRKIPYVVWSGYTFYDRKEVKDVLSYLYTIAMRDPTEQWVKRAINVPFRYISKQYVQTVEDVAASNKYSFIDALTNYKSPRENQNTSIRKFVDLLFRMNKMYSEKKTPTEILNLMLKETFYLRSLSQEEGSEGPDPESGKSSHVHQLLKIAQGFKTVDSFLDYVSNTEMLLKESRKRRNSNAVVLSTIHRSKGLQWDVIFAPGWNEGLLPHLKNPSQDEELRIAYVCLTRAAKLFRCSWTRNQITQGGARQLPMSKFIEKAKLPTIKVPVKNVPKLDVIQWLNAHHEFADRNA